MPKPIRADQFRLYKGLDVIPLHRPGDVRTVGDKTYKVGKSPLDRKWTTKKYSGDAVIQRCIAEIRNMGYRIPDEMVVLDVDKRTGGLESLVKFCKDKKLDTDPYPRVNTGADGIHLFGSKPPGLKINTKLEDYPGLEFKTAGTQVVCAGSIHPDTKRYYLFDDFAPPLTDTPPAWPGSVLKAIKRRKPKSTGFSGVIDSEKLAQLLAALDVTKFRDQERWRNLMFACHHATDGDGVEEFVDWSTSDPEYANDSNLIRIRWHSCATDKDGAITAASLYKELADAGARDAIPRISAAEDFADAPEIEESTDWDDLDETLETPANKGDSSWDDLPESKEVAVRKAAVSIFDMGFKVLNSGAPDTIANVLIAAIGANLDPRYDELAMQTYFCAEHLPWPESYGRVLDDNVLKMVRLYLIERWQGIDLQPSKENLIDAITTISFLHKFNPVLDYVNNIRWDGVNRVENLFGGYFACGIDKYTKGVSRAFMIGAIRRMRRPGCKFDTMPILKSPQGWNKSSALKVLFGKDWFSDADLGSLHDKDAALKLRGKWVQEFAEIDALTRSEVGVLKAFVSRGTDRQRDPYDRMTSDKPRRCVFVATVNESGYLKDSTGARRFWPLELQDRVDLERLEADRDQLWAEAATMEANGESEVLDEALWPIAAERQADQTTEDPWADTIRIWLDARIAQYEVGTSDDEGPPLPPDRVHTSELFDALRIAEDQRTKDRSQRLRTVMESALKWHHMRAVRVSDRIANGYIASRLASKATKH